MAGAELIAQGVDRRKAILKFIRSYIKRHGYGPSMEEIAEAVGLSKSAARHHLLILREEKKVDMTPGVYRSLRVL
jgi:repressor LexA